MAHCHSAGRKTVFIPVVSLKSGLEGHLLELIIEPAGLGAGSNPQFHHLRGHGLQRAIDMAEAALQAAEFSLSSAVRQSLKLLPDSLGPPVLFLANPRPNLSNASGAALGVAMGLLMYHGCCPGERLIATGRLIPMDSPAGWVRVEATDNLAERLTVALTLGKQLQPLPFMVPARTCHGLATSTHHGESLQTLAKQNIHVLPVESLQEAVTACQSFFRLNPPRGNGYSLITC